MIDTRSGDPRGRALTPLLELVTRESLDLGYEEASRQQKRAGSPTAAPPHRRAVVALVAFGLLVAISAVQTAENADVSQASRTALIDRIGVREDARDVLTNRIRALRNQNRNLTKQVVTLTRSGGIVEQDRDDLAAVAGFVAVRGPGLRVTVDDQPRRDPDGLVRSTDLRLLVNGLWKVGAEAITINGRRLTSLSAIVNSGIAIQVNKGPLSPPYVVQAIGGSDLQADLLESASGLTFFALAERFGFVVERENVDSLLLPAAPPSLQRLLYAERPSATGPGDQKETNP